MINNEKLVCQEDKNIHADQDDKTDRKLYIDIWFYQNHYKTNYNLLKIDYKNCIKYK